MNDGLYGCHASDPAVEDVVRAEVPASEPDECVVAGPEQPDKGEVGQSKDTGAVGDVAPELRGYGVPVQVSSKDGVADAAENGVEEDEGEDGEGLDARRDGAPADVLRAVVSECGRRDDISFQESI